MLRNAKKLVFKIHAALAEATSARRFGMLFDAMATCFRTSLT